MEERKAKSAGRTRRSWKEIADYLGVSVRAAQAWEKERGLPVHRMGTGTRARVFAHVDELDAWRHRRGSSPESRRRPFRVAAVVLLPLGLVGVAIVGWLWLKGTDAVESREPAASRLDGHILVVRNRDGKILWNREFPDSQPSPFLGQYGLRRPVTWVQDVDGDGNTEVLFSLTTGDTGLDRGSILYCFEADGKLRWSYTFDQVKAFEDRTFHGFHGHFLGLVDARDHSYLLAVAQHRYFPGVLVLLDPGTGNPIGEFWNPGHLQAYAVTDLDGDGFPELIVTGDNNPGEGLGHPFVAVLDLPFPPPQPELPDLFGEPSVLPRRYLLLPKIGLCEAVGQISNPSAVAIEGDGVRIVVEACGRGRVRFDFGRDLSLRRLHLSDAFRTSQREAFQAGLVAHFDNEAVERSLFRVVEFATVPNANSRVVARAFAECDEDPETFHCYGGPWPFPSPDAFSSSRRPLAEP